MIVANSVVSASYYAHVDMMSFRVLSAVKTLLVALLHAIVGVIIFLRVLIKSLYMWQSWVEIEHYSVEYFERITAFEVP